MIAAMLRGRARGCKPDSGGAGSDGAERASMMGQTAEVRAKFSGWRSLEEDEREHFRLTGSVVVCIYTVMSKELDFSVRQNCVCFNLRRVARVVTQFFDAEMRRQGIRSTQGTLLSALHSTGISTMADLSEILGMERTTLLRNLRPLQRDGLVSIDGGEHGGPVELSLTAKGRKQIEKLTPAWESAQRTAVRVLGEERWTALIADLDKVATALKK